MSNFSRTILFTQFLLLFMFSALSGKTVTTEGYGYNRDAAVNTALRNAVEQCVGISIGSKTLVENFSVISDKITTHTTGYVSNYAIISETSEFGLVKVIINAEVSIGKLEKDLVAQKLLYKTVNQPRIMVLLDERMGNTEMHDKTATFKFEQVLTSKGFIVVEPEQLKTINNVSDNGDNTRDLASLAFHHGADLIIRGSVNVSQSTPKTVYGVQFYTVPIQLNARIVRADNAQILVSRTKQVKKNSREEASAAQFGLETGGEELAQELLNDLMNYWQSETYNENRIEVTFSGYSVGELTKIEELLRKLPSVRDLQLRYFEGDRAFYDMEIRGSINELRAAITNNIELGFTIKSLSSNRIDLQKGELQQEISFEPSIDDVEITTFTLQDIFPSRIRYYESHPIASLSFTCNSEYIRDMKVSIIIPEIMTLPAELKLNTPGKGKSENVAVNLIPDREKLLNSNGTHTVYGQATVSFVINGKSIEKKLTSPVKIYERNAINWSNEESIGGFVTYTDPTVTNLSSQAIRQLNIPGGMNRTLLQGMALFQLLNALKITYVKDPSAQTENTTIDRIQFPTETLKRLSGDCDDLAVLYASLLSSVGIHTAIISYTDHVLVMFDTRIFEKNRYALSLDTLQAVSYQGTLWIPVETTMSSKGFQAAWQAAAKEFHQSLTEQEAISIVDLETAWKNTPPAPVGTISTEFNLDGLQSIITNEIVKLESFTKTGIEQEYKKIQTVSEGNNESKIDLLNKKGIICIRNNRIDEAKSFFGQAVKKNNSAFEQSNFANSLLLSGDEKKASELFDKIYKLDATGRIAVNRALCQYVLAQTAEESDRFIEALREAVAMMPSQKNLAEYLGIDLELDISGKAAEKEAPPENSPEKSKEVNIRRLKELIRQRVLSTLKDSTNQKPAGGVSGTTTETSTGTRSADKAPVVLPFGGIRGADPQQVSKIADLLYWFE